MSQKSKAISDRLLLRRTAVRAAHCNLAVPAARCNAGSRPTNSLQIRRAGCPARDPEGKITLLRGADGCRSVPQARLADAQYRTLRSGANHRAEQAIEL